MAVIPDSVRQQLKEHFETALSDPVHLTVVTRPGSSRLILPAGVGWLPEPEFVTAVLEGAAVSIDEPHEAPSGPSTEISG